MSPLLRGHFLRVRFSQKQTNKSKKTKQTKDKQEKNICYLNLFNSGTKPQNHFLTCQVFSPFK